jgi:hypothetical protein
MKPKQAILSLIAVTGVLLFAPRRSLAHHSRAMFDMAENITYGGVVEEYQLQNPHSHIVITVGPDTKNPSTVGTWDIEASSVNIMVSQGWNRTTYKPDGTRLYRAQHRYASEAE